jgi:thiamine kinase
MTSSAIADLCGGVIPGSGPLAIEPVRSGLVNATYRISRDGCAYALRVAEGRSEDLGQDREWEARLLHSAAGLRLAPPLVYCNPKQGVLVTRWVDGISWSSPDTRTASSVAKIAALLRCVHAVSIPSPPRVMSPASWVGYYGAALASQPQFPCAPDLTAAAGLRLAELAELPGLTPVVCHSDLHILNLLECEQRLLLLDWEYAHVSDPFWDLAGWSANNDFGDEIQLDLLIAYLGKSPTEAQWARHKLMLWLYDYVCLLWSGLYLSARPAGGDAIAVRARQLDARLRLTAH